MIIATAWTTLFFCIPFPIARLNMVKLPEGICHVLAGYRFDVSLPCGLKTNRQLDLPNQGFISE